MGVLVKQIIVLVLSLRCQLVQTYSVAVNMRSDFSLFWGAGEGGVVTVLGSVVNEGPVP